MLDLLGRGASLKSVVDSVLSSFGYLFTGQLQDVYSIPFSLTQFENARHGACRDGVNYFVNVFRALGIVCAEDFVPQWGAHPYAGHSWLYFNYGEEKYAADILGDGIDIRTKYAGASIPKVFRRLYSVFPNSERSQFGQDVTSFYLKQWILS